MLHNWSISQNISQDSDNDSVNSMYEQSRINKASNVMTADMVDFNENSTSSYKKRQRHQLSQKFKR